MTPIFNRFIEQLVLPPGVLLTGMVLIFWQLHRPRTLAPESRIKRAKWMLGVWVVLAWLVMLPVTESLLVGLRHPDRGTAMTSEALRHTDAQAIVVFGYGRLPAAPEYDGEDTLSSGGLARVRYAARLHRLTGLPLLLAGGRPYGEFRSEAAIMRDVLENEFDVPVAWLDEKSCDTRENAIEAAAILKQAGLTRILLVVHNRDMPRALQAFEQAAGASIQVTPAPILFKSRPNRLFSRDPATVWLWIPNADAMSALTTELHEWLGSVWYRLRFLLG
ncbi:MAG: YdcF family protein [Magnetococcus sp. YQC-9]